MVIETGVIVALLAAGVPLLVGLLAPFTMGSSGKVAQLFQSAQGLYGQADTEIQNAKGISP